MNLKNHITAPKLSALLTACALGLSSFAGVPAFAAEAQSEIPEAAAFSVDGSSELVQGTFVASDVACPAQNSYEYPFIGLNLTLPEALLQQMTDKTVAMLTDESWTDELDAIRYAVISFRQMTEEQSTAEVEKVGTGYMDWVDSLAMIGTIGMYDADSVKDLDTITGCTEHTELGKSSDGAYTYYLSLNKDADESLASELKEIQATLTEITPPQQLSAFDQPQAEASTDTAVGNFQMNDVDGTSYDQSLFADNEVTLVNVFTTWCSPCVNEIPELQKLSEQMKEQGVGVVGVVLDTVSNGSEDSEAIQKAQLLREKTGASYPFLIPDDSMMNGHLNGISAFPHSFFVDKNGNILGEAVEGSHDLEGWTELVNAQLEALKG